MKYFFTFIILLILAGGCKPKLLSGLQLENKLKETMMEYLDTTLQPGVTATIKDVSYYPEKDKGYYICQFHVNMHHGNKDTTGVVVATITNDFTKIERMQ